jgi:hypothetical protein
MLHSQAATQKGHNLLHPAMHGQLAARFTKGRAGYFAGFLANSHG